MEEMRALADVYMFSENHSVSPVLVGDDGALTTDPACPARAESLKNAIAEVADKEVPNRPHPRALRPCRRNRRVPRGRGGCHPSCSAVFELN
ncbi:MAG: hypothetical protein OXU96_08840 [Gammaproteobacteria bacterium]|nr:hypothetical protein [Gammaproteobacteria bacterium]